MNAPAAGAQKDVRVAFGLFALSCAFKAKTRQLRAVDIEGLAARQRDWGLDDMAEPVAAFAARVQEDPWGAADALQDALDNLARGMAPRLTAAKAGEVLDGIAAETAWLDDWRGRADAGL